MVLTVVNQARSLVLCLVLVELVQTCVPQLSSNYLFQFRRNTNHLNILLAILLSLQDLLLLRATRCISTSLVASPLCHMRLTNEKPTHYWSKHPVMLQNQHHTNPRSHVFQRKPTPTPSHIDPVTKLFTPIPPRQIILARPLNSPHRETKLG